MAFGHSVVRDTTRTLCLLCVTEDVAPQLPVRYVCSQVVIYVFIIEAMYDSVIFSPRKELSKHSPEIEPTPQGFFQEILHSNSTSDF